MTRARRCRCLTCATVRNSADEGVTTIDYEIRVVGDVPADVLAELHDAHLDPQGVETVLRGPVPDQAALVGIINWLQLIGVELREVRRVGSPDLDPADAQR